MANPVHDFDTPEDESMSAHEVEVDCCPLHAAAPMLLEALEDLLGPMDKKSIDILERVRNARAAIRAAKGESNV